MSFDISDFAAASCSRRSSPEVGTAFATLVAKLLAFDCTLVFVESTPIGLVWPLFSVAERLMGVAALCPGDPKEGVGEPYAGGASSPRCCRAGLGRGIR